MESTKVVQQYMGVKELYYVTHIDNIQSILQYGILSHESIEKKHIKYTSIYAKDIVSRRKAIKTPDDKSLWSFANLYFNARNPMLYRVVCEKDPDKIAVIGVVPTILSCQGMYITTGNAAHTQSKILRSSPKVLSEILRETKREFWAEEDGSKRKIMAECLVPDVVPSDLIKTIYVASHDSRVEVGRKLGVMRAPPVIPDPWTFFKSSVVKLVDPKLFLMQGDMFFSRMQTLTVSVNTVGIMGKGVASRAKDQFPDVYVRYQKVCRTRELKMGKPYLYKRETSTDYQLADDPSSMKCANGATWFFLFATKRHWRDGADINGIERGLKWLLENYKKEGIKSLAIPALGCGLGRLDWKDVGPLLCAYLSEMDIPVLIYLPAEKKIPDNLLSPDFLLSKKKSIIAFS
jgi:O-acetyl-ADP-ribose deacetylase (regulator of RNase III)